MSLETDVLMIERLFQRFLKGMPSEAHRLEEAPTPPPTPGKAVSQSLPPRFDSFEEIYRTAPANPPRTAYSILKVAEMFNSPHLAGMSAEFRRGSVMMAIEAAGVDVKDILQDAMLRQRALDDYEEAQQKKLQDFESAKAEANRKLQEELDRITAEYVGLIQSNVDEVARHQDAFRAWQKKKQLEINSLAAASAQCAQSGGGTSGNMAVVIEHTWRR